MTVHLTAEDVRMLSKRVEGTGGFQGLLRELQACRDGYVLQIRSDVLVEKIHRYADQYGGGGWQGRLQGWASQLERTPAAVQDTLFDRGHGPQKEDW